MSKNQNLSLNLMIVQEKGNIVSDMGGEKVMLSVHNGKYYNLGEIGGKIWDLLELPTPVSDLVTTLVSEYDIKRVQCEAQVLSFLESLLAEGIIHNCENINP